MGGGRQLSLAVEPNLYVILKLVVVVYPVGVAVLAVAGRVQVDDGSAAALWLCLRPAEERLRQKKRNQLKIGARAQHVGPTCFGMTNVNRNKTVFEVADDLLT